MEINENDIYKNMYFILTNGISQALEADTSSEIKQALINAVAKTEDIYIKYTLK